MPKNLGKEQPLDKTKKRSKINKFSRKYALEKYNCTYTHNISKNFLRFKYIFRNNKFMYPYT